MIELKNLSKFYNTNNVVSLGLKNINLKLEKGEIVALCGESGSGKSTLLNVITKMDTFDEGEYFYYDEETSYYDIEDMDLFRKNKVGFIFQNYNIIESYTVLENVMLPLKILGYSNKEAHQKALYYIEKVGLKNRIKNRGSELSGGEKQRTVIARALVTDCSILACDEPTGNLDSKSGEEIIKLISEIAKDKLVLIVTHNFKELEDVATRKITIKDGEIVEDINLKDFIPSCENEEVNLKEKNIKLTTLFSIAKNNLLNTPKKTIFTSLILILVSLAILISIVFVKETINDIDRESPFNERLDNISYVVNNNTEGIDLTSLEDKYEIVYNPLESTKTYAIYKSETKKGVPYTTKAKYIEPSDISRYSPTDGRYSKNEEEVFALIPISQASLAEQMFNQKIYFSDKYRTIGFNLVGYTLTKDIKEGVVLCQNKTLQSFFRYSNGSTLISYKVSSYGYDYDSNIPLQIFSSNESKLVLKTSYKDIEDNIKSLYTKLDDYNLYFNLSDNNITIEYSDTVTQGLYLSQNLKYTNNYEAYIYGDANKISTDISKLSYTSFSLKTYSTSSSFLSNLNIYLSIAGTIGIIIIVYFITYLIIKIAYKSKEKDYNILRTLGITKKNMSKIVFFELESQTLIFSLFTFLIVEIIAFSVSNKYLSYFKGLSFTIFILYFILVILLSYLIINRFNKNLFKHSVNNIFKGREK